MQIASLQRFVEIAQAGSLYQAAKRSHISVQSYAKTLSSLEKELGKPLATRSRAGIRLTPEGSLFLQFALETVSKYNAVTKAIDELPPDSPAPETQITFFATPYLMRVFSIFVDDYNLLFRYRWHQENFERLILRLSDVQSDNVFAAEIFSDEAFRTIAKNDIVATPYYRMVLGVIVRSDSPHASKSTIDCETVAQMPLCLYPQKERNVHRNLVFRDTPLTNVVVESESIDMLASFVRDNPEHGCISDSYMFYSLKKERANTENLRFIPFDHQEASAYLCLLNKKGIPRSERSQHFVNLLLELSSSRYSDYTKEYPVDL